MSKRMQRRAGRPAHVPPTHACMCPPAGRRSRSRQAPPCTRSASQRTAGSCTAAACRCPRPGRGLGGQQEAGSWKQEAAGLSVMQEEGLARRAMGAPEGWSAQSLAFVQRTTQYMYACKHGRMSTCLPGLTCRLSVLTNSSSFFLSSERISPISLSLEAMIRSHACRCASISAYSSYTHKVA